MTEPSEGNNSLLRTPNREEQALRELGRTAVSRAASVVLAALFLATISAVALIQTITEVRRGDGLGSPFRELASRLPEVMATGADYGLRAGNRELLAAMNGFEDHLEEASVLRERLLPRVQLLTTRWLGLGNEQAYAGLDGWLFYRADVDYVTGPGFLDARVLHRRSRGGSQWQDMPQPDPLLALEQLHRDLMARGVSLLVLPTPVKPALEPHRFSTQASAGSAPLRNPSFDDFKTRLAAAGIPLFDPAPLLAQLGRKAGRPQYLATDTHWTPEAVDEVARHLAAEVEGMVELSPAGPAAWVRREVDVEGAGDVAVMLNMPADQSIYGTQHVTIQQVSTWDGAPWRSDPKAEVLLLGDSFTNVYSEAGLGWGSGAGLAEQLTYYLQRPVDRLARNAGGAHAAREALQRALAGGEDRLAGKKVVIYQFSARELAFGDWRPVSMAP